MKTNNTVINSIMKGYMKYLCAVLLVISTCASAWATDCTYYVYDGSKYVAFVTQDQSKTVPQGPYCSAQSGVPYCWANTTNLSAIATAMAAKPTDYDVVRFYPNDPTSTVTKNIGDGQTAMYAVYGSYGSWSVTAVPDYVTSTTYTITMAVSPTGRGTAYVEGQSSLVVSENDMPQIFAVATSGWMFKEWTSNNSSHITFSDEEENPTNCYVDADVTITAVFEVPATITFNKNGGSGTMSTQDVIKNRATTLNENKFTAPSGKYFGGWSTSSSGVAMYQDKGTITTGSDITLYAVWVDDTKAAVIYELEGLAHDGSNPKTLSASATLYASFNLLSGYSNPVSGYVSVGDWATYTLGVSNQISYLAGDLTCAAGGIISAGDVVLVHLSASESTCDIPTVSFTSAGPIGKSTTADNFTNAASAIYDESSTGQTFTWESNNTSVATVDDDGEVDVKAAGTAIITVTAEEDAIFCEASASYTLYVGTAPTVNNTNRAYNVTADHEVVIQGCQVSNKGGLDITHYGWVVGTSTGPTVGSNIASYSYDMDIALNTDFARATIDYTFTEGTKYYFRAFATNQAGQTGYADEFNFTFPYKIVLDKNNSDVGSTSGYAFIRPNRTEFLAGSISAPTRSGYHIEGFYTDAECTQKIATDEYALIASITVSATSWTDGDKKWVKGSGATFYTKWESNDKTLAIADLDHVDISSYDPSIDAGEEDDVTVGTTVTLAYDNVASGYFWGGWNVYKTGDASTTVSVNGSNQFTMPDYNVTVSATLYTDLRAQCEDIELTTEDGDPVLITSRFETSKNINIMGTKKLLLTTENFDDDETVTISGTDLIFYTDNGTRYSVASLTTPLTNQELYVSYKPSSAGDGSITAPTITVTVGSPGTSEEFSGLVKVRNLPEKVAIVAKANDTWMALPAPASSSNPDGVVVAVNSGAVTGPSSLGYKLWPVKTTNPSSTPSDRFGTATNTAPVVQYGDRLRFAACGQSDKGLNANNAKSGTNIGTSNTITTIGADGDAPNEWIVTTTEVDGEFVYRLQTDQTNNKEYLRYWLAATGGPKWGTYSSGIQDIYLLPFTEAEQAEITVMEWGINRLAVCYPNEANCSAMTAKIGSSDALDVTITPVGGDIYTLTNVGNLQNNPGKTLTLTVTESGDDKEVILQIPFIITSAGGVDESTIRSLIGSDAAQVTDVVVRSGGKLTTSTASGKFKDLYIYPGGKADLSNNIGLKNIFMRGGFSWLGGDYAHPQLNATAGISISGIGATGNGVFYDLYLDNSIYYMFALPKTVAVTAITNEENGDDWDAWIKSYSGEGRTLSPKVTGWSYVTSGNIERGAGYEIAIKPRKSRPYGILRFPLLKATAWSDETDIEPTIKGWGARSATVTDNNKGWNLIGNPFLTAYNNSMTPESDPSGLMQTKTLVPHPGDPWNGTYDWATSDVKYFTIPRYTEYEYDDVRAYPYKLDAFFPFFIQATDDGTLSFDDDNKALKAPARFMEEPMREVMVDFALKNSKKETDVAGLTISDKYSADFDMNDKEKTIQNGTATMKVYTMVGEYRTAFNSLPEAAAAQPIPVGYIAPQVGTYKFSLQPGNYGQVEHVWLTDYTENNRVDLLGGTIYEFQTEAGVFNDRFAINVILRSLQETPTGVDPVETEYERPLKFMYQQKIYILRGGVIYDMTGKKVK